MGSKMIYPDSTSLFRQLSLYPFLVLVATPCLKTGGKKCPLFAMLVQGRLVSSGAPVKLSLTTTPFIPTGVHTGIHTSVIYIIMYMTQ